MIIICVIESQTSILYVYNISTHYGVLITYIVFSKLLFGAASRITLWNFRCLDASQISPAALQNVQRLLEKRGASFEASTAKRASAACAPLAAWVRANVEYACALQRVQPLQAHQARLHT